MYLVHMNYLAIKRREIQEIASPVHSCIAVRDNSAVVVRGGLGQ